MDAPATVKTDEEHWAVIGGDKPGIYNQWYDLFKLFQPTQHHTVPFVAGNPLHFPLPFNAPH